MSDLTLEVPISERMCPRHTDVLLDRKKHPEQSGDTAWRIRLFVESDGEWRVFELPFGRKLDVELAIRALQANGITDGDSAIVAGYERCRDICINAMQW